jgi:hypothetical protein
LPSATAFLPPPPANYPDNIIKDSYGVSITAEEMKPEARYCSETNEQNDRIRCQKAQTLKTTCFMNRQIKTSCSDFLISGVFLFVQLVEVPQGKTFANGEEAQNPDGTLEPLNH